MTVTNANHVQQSIAEESAPYSHPDAFFSETQIQRLQYLMGRVQQAEAPPEEVLSVEEYEELKHLIKAELQAAARRSATMIGKAAS